MDGDLVIIIKYLLWISSLVVIRNKRWLRYSFCIDRVYSLVKEIDNIVFYVLW